MNKIVVGFDSTPEGEDALRLADSLRDSQDSELIVVSVDELEAVFGLLDEMLGQRGARHDADFDRARQLLGDAAFSERSAVGSVPKALEQVAQAEEADAIVVGSTHRGTMGRVLPGSVGDRLLAGASCAVALAPLGYARGIHPQVGTIGVAYDGEDEAKAALASAAELARERHAELQIIAVVPTLENEVSPGRIGHTKTGYERTLRRHFEHALEQAEALTPDDVDVSTVILEGLPARQIAARGVELDLLVLGSRGYGPIRRTLLGGVARDVVTLAPCPVLVMPRSAREDAEAVEHGDGSSALA